MNKEITTDDVLDSLFLKDLCIYVAKVVDKKWPWLDAERLIDYVSIGEHRIINDSSEFINNLKYVSPMALEAGMGVQDIASFSLRFQGNKIITQCYGQGWIIQNLVIREISSPESLSEEDICDIVRETYKEFNKRTEILGDIADRLECRDGTQEGRK